MSVKSELKKLTGEFEDVRNRASVNEAAAIEGLQEQFAVRQPLYAFYKTLEDFDAHKPFLLKHPAEVTWAKVSYHDNDYYNPGNPYNTDVSDHRYRPYTREYSHYSGYRETVGQLVIEGNPDSGHASEKADTESIGNVLKENGLAFFNILYQQNKDKAEDFSLAELDAFIGTAGKKFGAAPVTPDAAAAKEFCRNRLADWVQGSGNASGINVPPPAVKKIQLKLT